MNENARIAFIIERDGEEAAEKFVEQGLALYIEAAIQRSSYKESIEEYTRFLEKESGKRVRFVVVDEGE